MGVVGLTRKRSISSATERRRSDTDTTIPLPPLEIDKNAFKAVQRAVQRLIFNPDFWPISR